MMKPASLRDALTAGVPHLAANPDALHVFVDEGTWLAPARGRCPSSIGTR